MNNTQTRIINHLQGATNASAMELAAALDLTVQAIRHHLANLEQGQIVEKVVQPGAARLNASGRGRPTTLYRLRPQSQENNLDALCAALLDESLSDLTGPERLQFLRRVITRLLAGQTSRTTHLGLRLTQAVQALNRMAYQARWEAHATAPRVFFNACPYLAILPEHPELCAMDSELLSRMSGLPAYQAARIDQAHYCLFTIGKEAPGKPFIPPGR